MDVLGNTILTGAHGFTSDSSLVTYQEDAHSEQTSSVGSPGLVCKSENSMQISDQVTMLIDPAQIQDTEHTQQCVPLESILDANELSTYISQPMTLANGQQYILLHDPNALNDHNEANVFITDSQDTTSADQTAESVEHQDTAVAFLQEVDGMNQVADTTTDITDDSRQDTKKMCIEHIGNAYVITVEEDTDTLSEPSTTSVLSRKPAVNRFKTAKQPTAQNIRSEFGADTDVTQNWFTTTDDKVLLQKNGVAWKRGQWAREEVELLKENIQNYCHDNNIEDPRQVIFQTSKDDRKDFYRTVSRGLDRPLFSVYRRVIRMYDQRNYVGKYSPEEIAKLKSLRVQYGSDWSAIGSAMGRSASSVKDRCRIMKDTCNAGKWFDEEESRLIEAVREFSGTQAGVSVTTGISWSDVAERVATRSEKQCRTKWLNYLNWKETGGKEWTREHDQQLILKVVECDVNNESEIDWATLSKSFTSCRSPQWLRGKWWTLKRHVYNYQTLKFPDLVHKVKEQHLNAKGKTSIANLQLKQMALTERINNILANSNSNGMQLNQTVNIKTEEHDMMNFSSATRADTLVDGTNSYLISHNPGDLAVMNSMTPTHSVTSADGSVLPLSELPSEIVQALTAQQLEAGTPVVVGHPDSMVELAHLQMAQVINTSTPHSNMGTVLSDDVQSTIADQLQSIHEDHNFCTGTTIMSDPGIPTDSQPPSDLVMVTTTPSDNNMVLVAPPGSDSNDMVLVAPPDGDNSDMVLVTPPGSDSNMVLVAPPGDFSHSEVVDGELIPVHMSTLSDPMLNSETADLMCPSDHENDKVTDI